MKKYYFICWVMLLYLQYSFWFQSGGALTAWDLKRKVRAQTTENFNAKEKNNILQAEVLDLKKGSHALEERARYELGMIKHGEVFYQIIDNEDLIVPIENSADRVAIY